MKKKLLTLFVIICLVIACTMLFAACQNSNDGDNTPDAEQSSNQEQGKAEAHTHTFADAWSFDETYHWHAATCEHTGEIQDKAEHDFNAFGLCECGKFNGLTFMSNEISIDVIDAGETATFTTTFYAGEYNVSITTNGLDVFFYTATATEPEKSITSESTSLSVDMVVTSETDYYVTVTNNNDTVVSDVSFTVVRTSHNFNYKGECTDTGCEEKVGSDFENVQTYCPSARAVDGKIYLHVGDIKANLTPASATQTYSAQVFVMLDDEVTLATPKALLDVALYKADGTELDFGYWVSNEEDQHYQIWDIAGLAEDDLYIVFTLTENYNGLVQYIPTNFSDTKLQIKFMANNLDFGE